MRGLFRTLAIGILLIGMSPFASIYAADTPSSGDPNSPPPPAPIPSEPLAGPSEPSTPPSPAPAAPAPPPAPPAQVPAPAQPAPATVLEKGDIQGVLGKDVRSTADENMGRIVDVIVDKAGRARAAVIDFGGFLGVGSRKIAVDWNALQFTPTEKPNQVTLNLTRDQVRAAPEYKEGKQAVVLGASGATEPLPDAQPMPDN
jgi:hypothetical protein